MYIYSKTEMIEKSWNCSCWLTNDWFNELINKQNKIIIFF